MGVTLAFAIEMKFLVALAVFTVVGVHATSDIVVKVEEKELSPLLRTFCCGNVQQRCARACTGRSCSLRCQGYCGIFNSRCGPYTCSSVTNAANSQQQLLLQQLLPLQLQLPQLVTPPQLAVTPQQLAVTPPQQAVTPPQLPVTPPQLAVTLPQLAVTPPQLAVTP